MGRGPKPTKGHAEPAVPRKSRKKDSEVRDLEKRLAEALKLQTEAQEQQTATSEILRVIASSRTDAQPVFDAIIQNATRLCEAVNGTVFRFDGRLIHVAAHHNLSPEAVDVVAQVFPISPGKGSVTGRAILTRTVVHIPDLTRDPDHTYPKLIETGFRAVLSVPMLRDREPIGAISVTRLEPRAFSESQIELLKTFADQAVIAIENVRLFNELRTKNIDLNHALERQTATAEILGVISSSPTDAQPVFAAIAENAVRLCRALCGAVFSFDGTLLHFVAGDRFTEEGQRVLREEYPIPPRGVNRLAIMDRTVVHVADTLHDPRVANFEVVRVLGARSQLVVP